MNWGKFQKVRMIISFININLLPIKFFFLLDLEPEVGRGEMALPTDQTGRFIHPIIDSKTGAPLLTDRFGRYNSNIVLTAFFYIV